VSTWQAVRATRAEQVALTQRDRAERNLGVARTVVDEMYTQVAQKLDDQKEMDDYQREILEKALRFYQQFVQPQSHDPQAMFEGAQASSRVGAIRFRLGNTGEAEVAYRQAIAALSGLVSQHPAELAYREGLVQARQELGAVFRDEDRWPEAEREFQAVAALWDGLAQERPEIAWYRSKLADVHGQPAPLGSLGDLYNRQARLKEAEAEYQLALSFAEGLAREHPEVTAYQESLAGVLWDFGTLLSQRGDLPGCGDATERAVAIMDGLTRKHPEVTKYQLSLAQHLGFLGYTFAEERKFPLAEATLKRSVAILEKLAADHPQNLKIAAALGNKYWTLAEALRWQGEVRTAMGWADRAVQQFRSVTKRDPHNRRLGWRQLWGSLTNRAETLIRLGRQTEALADLDEALELTRGSQGGDMVQAYHALTKARLGDLSELALRGDQLRETVTAGAGVKNVYGHWMTYYDGACTYSALSQLPAQDRGKQAGRRQPARRDLECALDLLEKSRAAGELGGRIHLDEVRRDPALDPLRSHPRFQLLMLDLELPDNPFGS
jgi:tetratricopeptide (TPR) repeat protein